MKHADNQNLSATASDAFCMAPFVHLAIAATGRVTPCCEAKGDFGQVARKTIDDIWTGGAFQDFRAKLMRGERDARCHKCYEVEEAGGKSLRHGFNERWASQLPVSADAPPPPPVSLDIRFSNLCNFSCRMCWHGSSSKWFADANALGWTAAPTALITAWPGKQDGIRALTPFLPGIKEIYWAGGEPLLMEDHYAILEALLEAGRDDVVLKYNSNLSELRAGKFDCLALWKRFKTVELQVSIDGTDARGELIRHGLSWPALLKNIAAVKASCPHVKIGFGITVSVFNVFTLDTLHHSLSSLNCCGQDDFRIHALQEPPHYSIQILPPRLKRAATRRLRQYAESLRSPAGDQPKATARQLSHIINYMAQADSSSSLGRFRDTTLQLDRLRGQNTAMTCPELASLLDAATLPALAHRAKNHFRRLLTRRLAIKRKGHG